ncbi:cell division protein FtsA [Marivivens donghaensis]|uniref:Cell division protein FtsA n=1 Tax=Marivivens donghaensis TaxID=1699413 RepID=A0ABX0W4V3_9RHOB|nr:cell division protein FtsA [Marivivens donghaensis]NIY73903.1 cell division protein FtsA [Marivivens donghaensis]
MNQLYDNQRAMRNMRKAALQRGLIAILDVGTSKVACLVLRFDGPDRFRAEDGVGSLAGQAQYRVIGASTTRSRGVRFGDIDAMQETERAIRTVVQSAQKMAGERVDHVIACLSGARPRSYGLAGDIMLDGDVVTDQDIGRVLAACDVPDLGEGREALHAHPINFSLDQRSGLTDPRGHSGNKMSADLHMLTVEKSALQNLVHCIRRCDLELAGIASSAYVAGISSLIEDEQKLGAACIDMGGGTTGVSIFLKNHMIYADSVRMGGDLITHDISKCLGVPEATAERIKTFYGGVVATSLDDREVIEIGGNSGDWHHDRRSVTRAELIGIMRPRVEEILEEVKDSLDAAGFDSLHNPAIVLTGGGRQIPGLDELATRILGTQVRLGGPMRVSGLPQAATGPAFAAAVGLTMFAAHPQDEWWDFEVPDTIYPARSLRRAVKWFKDNW